MKNTIAIAAACLLAGCGAHKVVPYGAAAVDLEADKVIIESGPVGYANCDRLVVIPKDKILAREAADREAARTCGMHDRSPVPVSSSCLEYAVSADSADGAFGAAFRRDFAKAWFGTSEGVKDGCCRFRFLYACREV